MIASQGLIEGEELITTNSQTIYANSYKNCLLIMMYQVEACVHCAIETKSSYRG